MYFCNDISFDLIYWLICLYFYSCLSNKISLLSLVHIWCIVKIFCVRKINGRRIKIKHGLGKCHSFTDFEGSAKGKSIFWYAVCLAVHLLQLSGNWNRVALAMTISRQVKYAAYIKQLCRRPENSRECVKYNFSVIHSSHTDIIGSKGRKKWELDEGVGFHTL